MSDTPTTDEKRGMDAIRTLYRASPAHMMPGEKLAVLAARLADVCRQADADGELPDELRRILTGEAP